MQSNAKVAVLGASGGIGQPLSLLLKNSHRVTHLSLYDVMHTPGVAADLSHISTKAKVTGHLGSDQLADAVRGADLVLIPAGVPRKPGIKLFIWIKYYYYCKALHLIFLPKIVRKSLDVSSNVETMYIPYTVNVKYTSPVLEHYDFILRVRNL